MHTLTLNILKHIAIVAFSFVVMFIGAAKAEAASTTYIIDTTGQGCGNQCAELYRYLAQINANNNTGTSTNGTGTSTATTTQPQQYPYQIYKNFSSTDDYYRSVASSSSKTGPYPYQMFSYFQNPAPKYDPYLTGQHPEQFYTYYGKSASAQLAKYQKPAQAQNAYANQYNDPSRGFSMTSIR